MAGRMSPESLRRTGVRLLQLATAILVLGYLASTVFRVRQGSSSFYDVWVGNLGYGGCALLVAWRAIAVRRQRWAWALIALSLFLFTAGAVLWTAVVQYMNPVPFPAISDLFFLVFYPVAYLGIGLLVRDTLSPSSRAIWLDGVIAALGVAALEATVVIGPIWNATHGSLAEVATNIAYPIGDLVLVMMVVVVFAVRGWRPGLMWWTLGAGLAIFAAADSVYVLRVTNGTYATGTPLDGMWLIGTFLIATAAWQRRTGPTIHEARHRQPIVVPAVFLLTSLGILVYATWHPALHFAVIFATATLIIAIGRTAQAFRELRSLAESKREARTDELTGLPNRRFFYEQLRKSTDDGFGGGRRLAVLMIDLDRFKEVNDSLGHHVGDDVLRQLGPRLSGAVGSHGTVARLGGDEFGLLLEPLRAASDATDLAEAIREVLHRPFELETMSLRVDASIGIALSPEHGVAADTLLQRADIAMYAAKRAHQSWSIYSRQHDTSTKERLQLAEDLRDAIPRGEMLLHYQPKLSLDTGTVLAVEALVRWEHPTRGLLLPGAFLELMEEGGYMDTLAMAVLDQALRQQAQWAREGHDVNVAVNLSPTNLRDEALPQTVAGLMSRHGVPPHRVTLEITEECLIADADQVVRTLAEVRTMGVEISVDDYGTGFSSLMRLSRLPVTELKLDRMFLVGVAEDERAISVIRSTVDLAHSLGLRIVVEGVEDAGALQLVADLGCNAAQGYFVGRPAPADAVFGAPGTAAGLPVMSLPAAVALRQFRAERAATRRNGRSRRPEPLPLEDASVTSSPASLD